MSFLYGIDFESFRGLFYVMLATGGVMAAIDFLYAVITVLRKQKAVMKLYLITFGFALFIPILLITFAGLEGAVLSYLIIMAILLVLLVMEFIRIRTAFAHEFAALLPAGIDPKAQRRSQRESQRGTQRETKRGSRREAQAQQAQQSQQTQQEAWQRQPDGTDLQNVGQQNRFGTRPGTGEPGGFRSGAGGTEQGAEYNEEYRRLTARPAEQVADPPTYHQYQQSPQQSPQPTYQPTQQPAPQPASPSYAPQPAYQPTQQPAYPPMQQPYPQQTYQPIPHPDTTYSNPSNNQ